MTTPAKTEFRGNGLSAGIAVGSAWKIRSQEPLFYRISISESEIAVELARFHEAVRKSRRQLLEIKQKFESRFGREHSYIIEAHLLMLKDQRFLSEIEQRIRQHRDSPEKAVRRVTEEWLSVYQSLDDPFFRERGSEFGEVTDRIIANLMKLTSSTSGIEAELPEEVILIGKEIGLSQLANYPLEKIKGMVLAKAGKTSHVAIVARSYRIPVVSGVDELGRQVRTGDLLMVDGDRGIVRTSLDPGQLERYRSQVEREKQRVSSVEQDHEPCFTRDGRRIYLYANTEVAHEVKKAIKLGAEGIGLFRSEYLYMKQGRMPSESEHFEAYRQLADSVGERSAIIRTHDVAEKPGSKLEVSAGEEKGVLGLRGIRFSLQHPEIFKIQVRAVLRARQFGNLKLVLPMVTHPGEVIAARALIDEVQQESPELSKVPIPVGVLIEVPATLWILDSLVPHADFLEVGTNDLIQYMLAASRTDDSVGYLYNPLHPAVLKNLQCVITTARKADLTALVCGEMAANPVHAAVLVGIGFRELSMSPISLLEVKRVLRRLSFQALQEVVAELVTLQDLGAAEQLLEECFSGCGISGVREQARSA